MNISLSCPTAFCITDKCRPDFKDFNFGRLHNPYASLTKQFILRRQLNKPNAMCSWHHFQFYLTLHFIIRFVHSPNLPYSPFYHFIHSSISFVPSFVFVLLTSPFHTLSLSVSFSSSCYHFLSLSRLLAPSLVSLAFICFCIYICFK